MKTHPLLPVFPLLALAACATPPPISANPAQTAVHTIATVAPIPAATVETGLQNASWNLDQAQAIGALLPTDPAPKCLHDVLTLIGLDPSQTGPTAPKPPASFTPKMTDLISGGAVLYIQIQQAKRLTKGGAQAISPACEQIIGQFIIDAASLGIKGIPGGGILPKLP